MSKHKDEPSTFILKPKNSLQEEFIKYFEAGLYTDCSIAAKCGAKMELHRAVLASHSEYLANLILKHSDNDAKLVFVFPDLEFGDLKKVVSCMYYGKLCVDEESCTGFIHGLETLRVDCLGSGKLGFKADNEKTEKTGANSSGQERSTKAIYKFSGFPINEMSDNALPAPSNDQTAPTEHCAKVHELPEVRVLIKRMPNFFTADPVPVVHVEASSEMKPKRKRAKRMPLTMKRRKTGGIKCNFCKKSLLKLTLPRHLKRCILNPNRGTFTCIL